MLKRNGLSALVLIAAITLSGCGGGGGGGGTPGTGTGTGTNTDPGTGTDPGVISSPTVSPLVSFMQSVASKDTGTFSEAFPGQANVWILDNDFSLVDGFDGQFDFALSVSVGSAIFDFDQQYSELTFYEPVMGDAEGVIVAKASDGTSVLDADPFTGTHTMAALAGTCSAYLNSTSDSRLQQRLDLTSVSPGTTITLDWRQAVSIDSGIFVAPDPYYRVVIRQEDGTQLKSLTGVYNANARGPVNQSTTDLSAYAGQVVVLSFEERSSYFPFANELGSTQARTYVVIDSVSAYTGPASAKTQEFVTNGDFETGCSLTGWTTNTPAESQNVTSGARQVGDPGKELTVTRSFYTVPNKLWGRWVDVYQNNTAADISTTVTYETDLGSDGAGVTYDSISGSTTPASTTKAVTSWDYEFGGRDIGLVFGNANTISFASENGDRTNTNDLVIVTYNITVPAGGRVAIVNFVIMDGTDTGLTAGFTSAAPNIAAKATEIDAEAAAIANNFWTDPQYRAGMTAAQIAAVSNFAKVQ